MGVVEQEMGEGKALMGWSRDRHSNGWGVCRLVIYMSA